MFSHVVVISILICEMQCFCDSWKRIGDTRHLTSKYKNTKGFLSAFNIFIWPEIFFLDYLIIWIMKEKFKQCW